MERTKEFLKVLEIWREDCNFENDIFDQYLMLISGNIGISVFEDNKMEALENRINRLVTDFGFREEFLVYSLINGMTKLLSDDIEKTGERIIHIESVINNSNGKVPNGINQTLERIKNKDHLLIKEKALDSWRILISSHFTKMNERIWSENDTNKNIDNIKGFMKENQIPENTSLGELREKFSRE